ncbi:MAG: hypothetical protein ACFBSG_18655 [Leptolyngbyaceae cyanobacterium]
MEKIKAQTGKVGELLFSADTGATYKKTVALTWAIIRETGILLWLVVCLMFVGGEWFWYRSIALGQAARSWYEGLSQPSEEAPKTASEIGQSAASAIATATETLLYQAKQQLGIEVEPPTSKPRKVTTKPLSQPAPESAKPTQTALAAAAAQNQGQQPEIGSFDAVDKPSSPKSVDDESEDAEPIDT